MTAAIGYALAAMVLAGLGDFVFKRAATGPFKTHQFMMVQSMCFTSLVWLYGWASATLELAPAVAWGLCAGAFMFMGFNCFVLSLEHGNVSINAPIFRLNFIVTAALAVALLGEPLSPIKLAGLALALLAIWLLVAAATGLGSALGAADRRSLWLAVTSTLALGCGNVLHKIGLSNGASATSLLAAHSGVFLTLATLVAVRKDGRVVVSLAVWPYALSGAALSMSGFVMMLAALALADASIVIPIAQMGLVVTALLGVAVLKEPATARKGLGLLAALGALGLLAVS